jgi:dTMP kinase
MSSDHNQSTQLGKFITIEGQDGAGKTTNLAAICAELDARNIDYIQTREPGGTELSEEVRALILNKHSLRIDELPELLLVFAARAQHLSELIKPTLEQGTWVVCDRFTDATLAYQGGGRGNDEMLIQQLADIVQQGTNPDLTVLLDVDLTIGEQRITTREEERDRFEIQKSEFKQRVRDTYLKIAKNEPQRVKVIDAGKSLEEVTQAVRECVSAYCDHLNA